MSTARCRYNENTFPLMFCLIVLYSEMSKPVGFVKLRECMGRMFNKPNPNQVRRGLNSAYCFGYLRVVEGKYGNKYVPTLKGVVDTGIYWSLKAAFGELIDERSTNTLSCLILLARNFALMNRLWLSVITQYLLKGSEIEELSLITLKALLGEEVEGLEPRHYREVMQYVELDLANIRSHFTQLGVSSLTRFPSPLESILTKACSKISRCSA
jgi:hypothetical protein